MSHHNRNGLLIKNMHLWHEKLLITIEIAIFAQLMKKCIILKPKIKAKKPLLNSLMML